MNWNFPGSYFVYFLIVLLIILGVLRLLGVQVDVN